MIRKDSAKSQVDEGRGMRESEEGKKEKISKYTIHNCSSLNQIREGASTSC